MMNLPQSYGYGNKTDSVLDPWSTAGHTGGAHFKLLATAPLAHMLISKTRYPMLRDMLQFSIESI